MAGNRAATEAFIVSNIEALVPGSENANTYKKLFAKMSDDEFDKFVMGLETGDTILPIVVPNFSKSSISVERNFALAKKLGHEFFQRIWFGAKGDTPAYLSPVKYLVVDLPLRRASQLLIKKLSVAEHNKTVDTLSGQPTGASQSSGISFPELQVMAAMGLDNSVVELMKYRGGDVKGHNALNSMISRYGSANQKTLANYSSGVESTRTMKTFLNCMLLRSTL